MRKKYFITFLTIYILVVFPNFLHGQNDPPVLSNIESSALPYAEEDDPVDITSTILITDIDDTNIESATIQITANYVNTEDVLDFTNTASITGSWNSSLGILTLTGSATIANYRTALRNVSYENTNTEDPSTLTRTVTFRVYDGDDYSNTQSRNISITAENDVPVLSAIEGSALSYTEDDGPVDITSTILITDVDDINIESATIQITSNYVNTEDVLDFTNTAFITGSWNSSLGRLTLTGSATIANYRTALRNVSYENTNSDDPSILTRTVTFRVFDGNDNSNTQSRNISITAENDPPVLSAIEVSTLSYTENDGPVNITSSIVVADVDDTDIEAATIQITSNYQVNEDTLEFTNTAFISGSWNPSLGRLTLTGSTTLANYQAALRNVTYKNTSENPSTSTRTVTFIVFDGDDPSNTQTRNISITAENDPPVLSAIEVIPLNYTEGAGEVDITDSIVVEDEDDTNIESAVIQITSNYQMSEDRLRFTNTPNISGSWNYFTGRLTLSGSDTKANYQAALRNVAYENIDLFNPSTVVRTVSFTINDGNINSNTITRNIKFTVENDPPVLANVEPVPLVYTEEDGPVDITSTITISDDDDDSLEYATVQITSNYLNSEDVLDFTNTASITSSWNSFTGTLTLTGSTTLANYQAALRNVSYENTNDEDPSILSRSVTFIVNDGDDPSNAILRTILITSVNDPPVLDDIEETLLDYTEDEGPVDITSTISITDVDDDSLEYATIRITSNYIFSEDTLRFNDTPSITSAWNQSIGRLTLTGPDTKLNFQAALRNVAYENKDTLDPSTLIRQVTFIVNDGDNNSNTQVRNIAITQVNDPPELSKIEITPISYSEGDGAVKITSTILLEDHDDVNIESAVIQIITNYISNEDTLRFEDTPQITSSWNQFTGTLTLTGPATKSLFQTALRNVEYENLDTLNIAAVTRTVAFLVNDGDDISNIQSRSINVSEDNDPPIAFNVNISGNPVVNSSLTGLYGYNDPENDPEGISTYTWYRSANADGTDSVKISGANNVIYVTRTADGGNYLSFGVKPSDNRGATSPFIFNSDWEYINDGPVALNLSIAGAKAIDQTDTASFDYFDFENDPENPANHYYQWYRADDATGSNQEPIIGATNKTYTITNQDNHHYIAVEVALASTTGTLLGDTAMSIWYGEISNLPSATISGTDTICPDEEIEITISYIGENPPWSVTYTIDGGGPYTINDIDENETSFLTSVPGTYKLQKISDDKYKNVSISDSVIISLYEVPTVVLSGIVTDICDDGVTVGVLEADFTGEAPWTLTLDRPAGNDTTYTNIILDPFTMNVLDEYVYRVDTFADANCPGDTTGSGSVSVKHEESPEATISGTDTICLGDTAYLTVTLTDGYLPWQFTYTIDGLDTTTITNITEYSYVLEAYNEGVYELAAVQDPLCTGRTSGTGSVYYRSIPTATLSGGGAMCQGTSTSISVALTGTAPWDFKYKITTDTTIYPVKNVLTSPRQVNVTNEGQYILTEVTDKYCPGTVSGTVYVSIIPVDPVNIYGLQQAYSYTDDPVPLLGDPEGGNFSGPGLIISNDTTYFLPGWAGITEEDDPPHKIIYSYQFPSGCYGRDTVSVRVLSTTASIIFPDNKTFYCYNDKPFTVEGFNIFKNPDTTMVLGEFSISDGLGLVDNGNNTATIDPQILQNGVFTITYSRSNGNSFEETEQFEVQYVDQITIIGFTDHEYCSNDEDVRLIGNVTEGVFYGNHVTKTGTYFYFVPSFEPAGIDTIFYSYTTPQGCSRVTFDTAFIFEAPEISFMVDDVCIAVGTNDSTQFINNTTSSAPVVSWEWNFGDPGSLQYNTSTLENPKHLYTVAQTRPVALTAETNECQATATEYINFGDVPVADFNWESECYLRGIPIRFTNNSTSNQGSITSNEWKFYINGSYTQSFDENPEITYSNYGDYDVELIVETDYQCIDTVIKTLHLRRTILAEYEYFEDFEQGVSGWYPDYINNPDFNTNSWTFGEPDGGEGGFSGAASGINAWYTDIEPGGSPSPREKSWIKSPCFDFSDSKRPMIKLNIWRLFNETRDGAVLQYTTDSSKTWNDVGDLNTGINWYNKYTISVIPGDNGVGWSDMQDNDWTEARHKLDNLKGHTNIQFRVAYGSDGTAINNNGIAFDNIWIGEREKTVLVEHFTNTLENNCMQADSLLNSIVNYSNDVIDIQYHTSIPEPDPFYLHNPESSGAREVYYGLSSVPYSMIDGGVTSAYRFDYDLKDIEEIVIDTQALKDPLFELQLNTENTGNNININCMLNALTDIPDSWITLYIAVIEREITQITGEHGEKIYESVIKKILPSPAGTSYNRSWSAGEQVTVNQSWTYTNVFDADEIRVVAFVQNENTGDIYQATIDQSDFPTSINDGIRVNQPVKLLVYPNPSSGITYIRFNQPLIEDCRMELFNNMGKLLYSAKIYKGEELVHFNTENYNNGLYILRIVDNKRVIDVKKLIISR